MLGVSGADNQLAKVTSANPKRTGTLHSRSERPVCVLRDSVACMLTAHCACRIAARRVRTFGNVHCHGMVRTMPSAG
jgi:hypothetical protein